jgi:hypothetical protein
MNLMKNLMKNIRKQLNFKKIKFLKILSKIKLKKFNEIEGGLIISNTKVC